MMTKKELSLDMFYPERIFRLAENKTPEIFYNSSSEHAKIVHQALMKTSEKYICIYCGSMYTEISNNPKYLKLMEEFLNGDKERSIKILFADYNPDFIEKPVAQVLANHPRQVKIKTYTGEVKYTGTPVHFTVADDRAFRLETDIQNHIAQGNFNSPKQANKLKNIFDSIFASQLAVNLNLSSN